MGLLSRPKEDTDVPYLPSVSIWHSVILNCHQHFTFLCKQPKGWIPISSLSGVHARLTFLISVRVMNTLKVCMWQTSVRSCGGVLGGDMFQITGPLEALCSTIMEMWTSGANPWDFLLHISLFSWWKKHFDDNAHTKGWQEGKVRVHSLSPFWRIPHPLSFLPPSSWEQGDIARTDLCSASLESCSRVRVWG